MKNPTVKRNAKEAAREAAFHLIPACDQTARSHAETETYRRVMALADVGLELSDLDPARTLVLPSIRALNAIDTAHEEVVRLRTLLHAQDRLDGRFVIPVSSAALATRVQSARRMLEVLATEIAKAHVAAKVGGSTPVKATVRKRPRSRRKEV
jgi:hypothetical protein